MTIFKSFKKAFVSEKIPETIHISVHEKEQPIIRVISNFDKTIGEKPPIKFQTLLDDKDKTPQLDAAGEYMTNLIVGTEMNINSDDDEAKKICEEFSNNINLYDKVRSITDVSLTCGFGLWAKNIQGEKLINLEEVPVETITLVNRDVFGNVLNYIQTIGGEEHKLEPPENFIPIVFRKRGRDVFGRSFFHSLAVGRDVGNRHTKPLIQHIWAMEDAMVGTFENFAYPVEYHVFENTDDETLEKEAQKIKDGKPGDKYVSTKKHEIVHSEVHAQGKFESYVKHMEDTFELGTGFPYEILLGDFTSRASSQTTDSLFMRNMRARQKYLSNILKQELFEPLLRNHESGKWNAPEKLNMANITVSFETNNTISYTPEQAGQRFKDGVWSRDETREYDKTNGQDLFDDEFENEQELIKEKRIIRCTSCKEGQHGVCTGKRCNCTH